MSEVARLHDRGMRSAIHIDDAERMRSTRLKQVDAPAARQVQQLDAVRGLKRARRGRRLAARIRLVREKTGVTHIEQGLRPWLYRNLVEVDETGPRLAAGPLVVAGDRCERLAAVPHAGLAWRRAKVDGAVRPARSSGRRCRWFRAATAACPELSRPSSVLGATLRRSKGRRALSDSCGGKQQGQDDRDDAHATRTILHTFPVSQPPC